MSEHATARVPGRNRLGVSSHYFFSFAATGFTVTFLPLYLRARGLSLREIGTLTAIYAFAGAGLQIPLGAISDRLGSRRPLAVTAAFALGICYMLLAWGRSFWHFFLLYLAAGILFYTAATLVSALIADWTTMTRTTGHVLGTTRIWGSIGFIVSLSVMSLFPTIAEGHKLLFVACALFWLAGLSISVVAESPRHAHEPRGSLKDVPKLLRKSNLVVFLLSLFLYRISESTANGFLSLYLKELHASIRLISSAWAFAALVEIPFMLWVGGASDRMGRRPPMVIAFLAMPIRLFLYSHLRTPTDVFYIQLLQGFTFSFMLIPSVAFVADLSPGRLRATGQGILSMTSGTAMALGPFLGGWMADKLSMHAMYYAIACASLLAGSVFILFIHESQPDIACEHLASRAERWHPVLRPAVRVLSRPLFSLISR